MNRQEVIQTLSILKAAFPHSYRGMTKADGEAMIALWELQFSEEDPKAVGAAVNALISTRTAGYSPTVGEIKDQLHRLRTVNRMNAAQAWTLVEKACRRGLYNSREEFEKLPPDVQAAVGGPEQLKAWAMMDSETVNSVVASNFQKTFRTVQQREKEKAMMPPAVQQFIAEVSEKIQLADTKRKELPAKQEALPPAEEPAAPPPSFRPEYKPPSEDEWEKMRESAMNRLLEAQKP